MVLKLSIQKQIKNCRILPIKINLFSKTINKQTLRTETNQIGLTVCCRIVSCLVQNNNCQTLPDKKLNIKKVIVYHIITIINIANYCQIDKIGKKTLKTNYQPNLLPQHLSWVNLSKKLLQLIS
jgi:hypothetical protein